jgi:trimeric autotransporter adhesin
MKSRNIIAILSALVCFGLLPRVQATSENEPDGPNRPAKPNLPIMAPAPETPDPGAVGGSLNTADGDHALFNVTTGIGNAAFGWFSLVSNTDGSNNTAVGAASLVLNIGDSTTGEGQENTGIGAAALLFNTTGSQNTAVAAQALLKNDSGIRNTGIGSRALINNVSGDNNTAVGRRALEGIISGDANTAVGWQAGFSATGNNNIYIGQSVFGGSENNTIRIGDNLPQTPGVSACFIGGIFNQGFDPATAGFAIVDGNDKVGFAASSRRFKRDIEPMDKSSEAILALKPVTFHYNSDKKNTPCFGLIAEDVAAINGDLVIRDKKGETLSVRYDQVWNMMLNEFLKEHKKVKDLEATVAQQQKGMEILTAQLKEQAAQIQKVSAQLEVSKPATKVVVNKP